jgi:aspartate-semialdehyde dehydrogenase
MLKKKSTYNVAVVGAKGAVGQEMVALLEARKFPVGEFRPFGSSKTKGSAVRFNGKDYSNQELKFTDDEFKGIDIILSSPGAQVSKQLVPHALKSGAVVIDNTSAFRMDPGTPLVVPEINAGDIAQHKGIIANPNCSAIIMLMAVAPLHKKSRIKRILCATYQSVSGAGAKAMEELKTQTRDYLEGKPLKKEVFPYQIAFNLFSHNSAVESNGYNGEELKMIQESRKILHDDSIQIVTTCMRVPVLRAHTEVLYLEFEKKMNANEARRILSETPGIEIVDDAKANHFPMPIEASSREKVLVGRIREDLSSPNGLALIVSGDQLWKGAALNAVQIAEHLIRM